MTPGDTYHQPSGHHCHVAKAIDRPHTGGQVVAVCGSRTSLGVAIPGDGGLRMCTVCAGGKR